MDYLLELSTVAKMEAKLESTGFENITSYLDDFQMNSHSPENGDTDKAEDYPDDTYIDETGCHDLDMLLDEALDRYGLTSSEDIYSKEKPDSSLSEASISSVMSHQVQSTSPGNTSFHTEYVENIPQNQISLDRAEELQLGDTPHKSNADSISTTSVKSKITELELTADFMTSPGTHDIFLQNDKVGTTNSQRHFVSSKMPAAQKFSQESTKSVLTGQSIAPSVSPKSQYKWNPLASTFIPAANPQCSFITPVVANPVQWPYAACAIQPSGVLPFTAQVPPAYAWNPFSSIQWTAENVKPISVPKPKPQLIAQTSKKVTRLVGKVLMLLRGAPGSGKTTLAR